MACLVLCRQETVCIVDCLFLAKPHCSPNVKALFESRGRFCAYVCKLYTGAESWVQRTPEGVKHRLGEPEGRDRYSNKRQIVDIMTLQTSLVKQVLLRPCEVFEIIKCIKGVLPLNMLPTGVLWESRNDTVINRWVCPAAVWSSSFKANSVWVWAGSCVEKMSPPTHLNSVSHTPPT